MDQDNREKKQQDDRQKTVNNIIKDRNKSALAYLQDLVYLLAGMLLVFLLIFRVVVVSGNSMHDTLVNGDYVLLLNNIFYSDVKQGDIVVVSKSSYEDGEPIIKRVIATEGQTVTIKDGIVSVDGVELAEPYLDEGTYTKASLDDDTPIHITVEEGHVFCLGDNRGVSADSRNSKIGQVDCREIIGRAILIFLPRSVNSDGFDFKRFGVAS